MVGTSAKCRKNPKLLGCHKRRSGGPCNHTTNVPVADPTDGSNTNERHPASRRTSCMDEEEQHCPWCYTRKNKSSNLAQLCISCGSSHTLGCLGNKIWQSRGGHYLSPSSKPVQSTHNGFISVASPNSSLPRKLYMDFGKWSLKNIGGHCHIYILFFSPHIIPRPHITIPNVN